MSSQPDFVRKKIRTPPRENLAERTRSPNRQGVPRIGGRRICQLCADMILEVVFKRMRSKDHLVHGQVLWMAVSLNDPPRRRQRISDVDLVPVLLDISTAEDVQLRIDRLPAPQRLLRKAIRLCEQAHNRADCSPIAISPSCSVSLTAGSLMCWPSMNGSPRPLSHNAPHSMMWEQD